MYIYMNMIKFISPINIITKLLLSY